MTGGEDQSNLLRSTANDSAAGSDGDLKTPRSAGRGGSGSGGGFRDLLRQLDRGLSGRRHSFKRIDRDRDWEARDGYENLDGDVLGERAQPEWALLLIGCLLGVVTGLFVAVQ